MTDENDLMEGAEEIGSFINKPPRRTYALLEAGHLPAFKLGSRWHARKTTILAYFAKLEASGGNAG